MGKGFEKFLARGGWVKKGRKLSKVFLNVFECYEQKKGDSSSKLERIHLARVVDLVQCQFAMSGAISITARA